MVKVSDALMSSVFGYEVSSVDGNGFKYSFVVDGGNGSIDEYELTHMMKEWAWKRSFNLSTCHQISDGKHVCETSGAKPWMYDAFSGESELESVVKTCEWILEEDVPSLLGELDEDEDES